MSKIEKKDKQCLFLIYLKLDKWEIIDDLKQ